MSMDNSEIAKAKYEEAVRKLVLRYLLVAFLVFLVGGVMGILIRLSQSSPYLNPSLYYRFLTLHGVSMTGFIILALIGIGWLVIVKMLNIVKPIWRIELVFWLIFVGYGLIAVAILVGKFATGFPAMPPLPVISAGGWPRWAASVFFIGLATILIAAITFFVEWLLAAHQLVGGIGEALGLDAFVPNKSISHLHSPAILALTAMSLVGVFAEPIGIYLLANLFIRNINPAFAVDPMMAKNALWMFGHTLVNILFWGAFSIVYLLVPAYTGREWKAYRLLVGGWLVTIVTTGLTAFLHHLSMDFAIPFQLLLFGQIATYVSVIPWAAVSVYGALTRIWKSGIEWKPAPRFVYLGLFGFMIGGTAAFLDATIGFNRVLHNTLWVPGHFHSYIMMGSALFIFAAIYHFLPDLAGKKLGPSRLPLIHYWLTLVGGLGFLATFYLAGLLNAPRRFAEFPFAQLPQGINFIINTSIPFAAVFGLGQVFFIYYLLRTLLAKERK
ncbi:MAG: cbb3-type cytochrome c oxidase subunit I [Chloroflexi bacterium]|nr:cbb3-type cytochrome c oxidase subunit I [Chloroflexota bacterium]